jgi:hypothetical protein
MATITSVINSGHGVKTRGGNNAPTRKPVNNKRRSAADREKQLQIRHRDKLFRFATKELGMDSALANYLAQEFSSPI